MRKYLRIALLVLLATASAWGKSKTTLNMEQLRTTGIASWYGTFHQGKRMSNGKPFDRQRYTCASRTYKLGTVLLVSYPAKGTFVSVVVTDRGPYKHAGRVLDLK